MIEGEVRRFRDRPALDLEVEAHDRFAEERSRIYIGRQAVLDTIADYIHGPERRPLVTGGAAFFGSEACPWHSKPILYSCAVLAVGWSTIG